MKILFLLLFLIVSSCYSQEIQPRAYSNIPKNLNIFGLGYSYSTGNILVDATSPLQNLDVTTNVISSSYVRTFSLFNKLAKFQLAVPFAFMGGSGRLRGVDTAGSRTGFTDAGLKFSWNFLGSKALDMKHFSVFKQSTILGASFTVGVPIGLYYPDKLINLGSNRWSFKTELGFSTRQGPWYFDAYAGVWLLTENTEYLIKNSLKQYPLSDFQLHISYTFPKFILLSTSFGYVYGGRTSVNGVDQNNLQNNKRFAISLSVPLSKLLSTRIQYNSGIVTRVGGDFKVISLSISYIWM